jgi:hypothetical protein
LPVIALSALTSHWHSPPNDCIDKPTRPYATARSAAANSRAMRRIVSSAMPVRRATRRAGNARAAARS